MPPEDNRSSLEKAREKLYAVPGTTHADEPDLVAPPPDRGAPRPGLGAPAWKNDTFTTRPKPHKHVRFAMLFFWVALTFFLIAGGTSAYLLFSGTRSVSTARVILTMQGPASVAAGDTVSLLVTITNRNVVPLKNVKLSLVFPKGTRSPSNVLAPLVRTNIDVGTIAPGETVKKQIKSVLFGGQGDTLPIQAAIQFNASGSNATFTKKAAGAVSIVSTPLSVSIDAPASVIPGQVMSIVATVRSNSTKPISGTVLHAVYPAGFTVKESSLSSLGGNFSIGTIAPGQTRVVHIKGVLFGKVGSQQAFQFTVGTATTASSGSIAIAYMTQTATVTFTQPFIATILTVNGGAIGNTTLMPGTNVTVSIAWMNTLTVPVTNARVAVELGGDALVPSSVKSPTGKYQSSTHTVVFSRDTNLALSQFPPGAQGTGTFTFQTLSVASTTEGGVYHPTVTLRSVVSGEYPGQDISVGTTTADMTQKLKLGTLLLLNAYALHATGPFANTGPVPPIANTRTTYTIVWRVHNTLNDVGGATVSANLPTAVTFVGSVSPRDGSVTYNGSTHAVRWSIGNISSNTTRTAMFQVAITPSTSVRGVAPPLLDTTTVTAFDRFAQITVSSLANAVTTTLSHESQYDINSGTVR